MSYSRERFHNICIEFMEHEEELLGIKRSEYTADGDADCLQNFRQVGDFEGRRPEEVCMTYIVKHLQSLQRAIATGDYEFVWWSEDRGVEGTKQRIADLRNYMLLLAAILDERGC